MAIAIDFAWYKPSAAQAKSWGAVAAGMYVSHDPSKNANAQIVHEYAAAGIKTFLFFEDTAARATSGHAGGLADADFAYRTAAAYGMPGWAPIIPTFDYDVPDAAPGSNDPLAKLGVAGQYAEGWHEYNVQHQRIADAAYGDFYVIKRLTAARLCTLGVQTIAWSGGQVDLHDIVLLQRANQIGQVDIEEIESASLLTHLAWMPGQVSPVAPPKPRPPVVLSWSLWPYNVQLQYGNTGVAVMVLQKACRNSGLAGVRGINVDGQFGPQTLTAVRNFQAHKNLTVDGIAGPFTRNALMELRDL